MELYPNRILLWRDKGPITSCLLLHSTHWFALYADGPASSPTLFSHGAAMSGPGLQLPWLLLSMNATRWRFEKFNKALKKEVEAQVLRVSVETTHCCTQRLTMMCLPVLCCLAQGIY